MVGYTVRNTLEFPCGVPALEAKSAERGQKREGGGGGYFVTRVRFRKVFLLSKLASLLVGFFSCSNSK